MKNLHLESLYLQGARDLLLRLQEDYEMYLIPAVKCKCRASYKDEMAKYGIQVAPYEYFPLNNTSMRKLIGSAFTEMLLQDRKSLVAFLEGNNNGFKITDVEKDKKGKIKKLKIELV